MWQLGVRGQILPTLLLKGFSWWAKPKGTHLSLHPGSDHYHRSRHLSDELPELTADAIPQEEYPFPRNSSQRRHPRSLAGFWTWDMTSCHTWSKWCLKSESSNCWWIAADAGLVRSQVGELWVLHSTAPAVRMNPSLQKIQSLLEAKWPFPWPMLGGRRLQPQITPYRRG